LNTFIKRFTKFTYSPDTLCLSSIEQITLEMFTNAKKVLSVTLLI